MTRPPDHPATRRVSAAVATALLSLALAGAAGPPPQAGDQPPAPGALERELSLPPASRAGAAASGGGPPLSNPIEIPFIFEGGHIIVEASIDGTAPRPFMFDTGARITITPEVAHTLNAAVVDTGRVGGIGPKISRVDKIKVGRISIGPATIDGPTVSVLEMPNVLLDRGSRPRLGGLIGSELLARYAVSIDFQRRLLILNSPGYRPHSAAFSLPLGLVMLPDGLSHPSIAVEVDGAAGDFIIDTGASGQVLVSEKFQQEHRPFAQIAPILRFLSPGGVGGHVNVQMGFGKRLQFGSSTLSPPVVSGVDELRGSTLGRGMASHISGVIGTAILAQFIVTIDYQSVRAYFEPVAGRPLPTALHGTGMILDKPDHEAFEILDILKGSSADRAALRRGDRIVEVAGHPAHDLSTSDVQSLSSAPAHTSLTIRTSDQRRIDLAIRQTLP
ncbi:MAG: aspartyl protease family protein [Xanthobacteraceae bacterium]|nr:aspartyl protease family protein [Xanthobacteraceae bacterium]